MGKDNEQGKTWEEIAIPGFEPAENGSESRSAADIIAQPTDPAGEAIKKKVLARLQTISGELSAQEPDPAALSELIKIIAQEVLTGQIQDEERKEKLLALVTGDLFGSAWTSAALEIKVLYLAENAEKERFEYDLTQPAVYLFFAKHSEIQPLDQTGLSPDQREDLRAIFYRLESFYRERVSNGAELTDPAILEDFISKEAAEAETAPEKQLPKEYSIPAIEFSKARRHIMPITKLSNVMSNQPFIDGCEFYLDVIRRPKLIQNRVTLSFDEGDSGISLRGGKISEYQRQVSNAIFSIINDAIEQGARPAFTLEMIYKNMPGGGEKLSDISRREIKETVETFRRIDVDVDDTEELRARGILPAGVAEHTYSEKYLDVRPHNFRMMNGAIVTGYEVISIPVELRHASKINQIASVSRDVLEIKKTKKGRITNELIKMNSDRIAIAGYLMRQIAIIKRAKRYHQTKISDHIVFDTIFEKTETVSEDRAKMKDNRDFCFDCLDYWKAIGFIQNYENIMKGRKYYGILIYAGPES